MSLRLVVVLVVAMSFALACGGVEEPGAEPIGEGIPALPTTRTLPAPTVDDGEREPDCNIEKPGDWDLMLASTQSGGEAPVVVRGEHGVAETVRLSDGTVVRVVRGGCQHVGETWTVTPPVAKPEIAAMRALLQRVERNPAVTSSLLGCLDDSREPEQNGFDCGDAFVSRATTADTTEFTWSFAL